MQAKLAILLFGLLLALRQPVCAQTDYLLGVVVIAGGGGETSGSGYSLSSTLGEWDAGPTSVAAGSVSGGFWAMEEVLWLRIEKAGNSVLLTWPATNTGAHLQESSTLGGTPAAWGSVTQTPIQKDGQNQVTLPMTPRTRFFRLFKP